MAKVRRWTTAPLGQAELTMGRGNDGVMFPEYAAVFPWQAVATEKVLSGFFS